MFNIQIFFYLRKHATNLRKLASVMIIKFLKTDVEWILETSCLLNTIKFAGRDSRVRLFKLTDISEPDSVSIIRAVT